MTGRKRTFTKEHRENLRLSALGRHHSEETREKMSKARIGKHFSPHSEETRAKMSRARMGITYSDETRRKMAVAHSGSKCPFWRGGVTSVNAKIRQTIEYRLWREAVFARDNWTCQECGERGGDLNAHHIQPFSEYPELRVAIDNGITLCRVCHAKRHPKVKCINI